MNACCKPCHLAFAMLCQSVFGMSSRQAVFVGLLSWLPTHVIAKDVLRRRLGGGALCSCHTWVQVLNRVCASN